MPRGGKRGQHKGGRRIYTSPEELEAQQRQRKKKEDSDNDESEEEEESEDSDEDESAVKKGTQGLIEVENLNRMPQKQKKVSELNVLEPAATAELSRREREELEREAKRKEYERLHQLGKTAEAQADLARLAIVRKEREEAARKREEEKKSKEAVKMTKQAETNIAQGKTDTKKPVKSNEKTTEKIPTKAGGNKPKDGT